MIRWQFYNLLQKEAGNVRRFAPILEDGLMDQCVRGVLVGRNGKIVRGSVFFLH